MEVTQLIREKLLNDLDFRLKTASALSCSERNVKDLAKRNSDNLTKMAAVIVFREAGFTDEQIFEPQSATA